MKIRKSHIFKDHIESEKAFTLKVITKFPEKWILIDTETCKIFNGTQNENLFKNWDLIKDEETIKKLIELIKNI